MLTFFLFAFIVVPGTLATTQGLSTVDPIRFAGALGTGFGLVLTTVHVTRAINVV